MIDIQENSGIGQILTLLKPLGKGVSLQVGEIVEALVVDLFPFGGLTLKLGGSYLPARTDLAFEKNDTLFLKVMGLKAETGEVSLQLVGNQAGSGETVQGPVFPEADGQRIEGIIRKIADLILQYPEVKINGTQSAENKTGKSLQAASDSPARESGIDEIVRESIPQRRQDKDGPEEVVRALLFQGGESKRTEDPEKGIPELMAKGLEKGVEEGHASGPFDRSPDVGRLRGLLENLLKALPLDVQTLPKGLRVQIQQVLQASLSEPAQGLPEKMVQVFNRLPEEIRALTGVRELLEKNLIPMSSMRSGELKNVLENSGIVLEARLKALIERSGQGDQREIPVSGKIPQDLKGLLLKLKEVLQENKETDSPAGLFQKLVKGLETGREGEARPYENILGKVDTLLKDVETFQLLSKITDSFYVFLPVQWAELKRGELIFKRRRLHSGGQGYSCSIHMELERVGPVSVFIYMQQRDFFVTFKVEHAGLNSTIHSHLGQLKETFSRAGLNLKNFSFLRESDGPQEPFDRIGTDETIVSIRI